MQGFQLIMNFLVMPIFFLSGALFPLGNLPAALTVATRVDPLSYGVDGLRGALIGAVADSGSSTDAAVLTRRRVGVPGARRPRLLTNSDLIQATQVGR